MHDAFSSEGPTILLLLLLPSLLLLLLLIIIIIMVRLHLSLLAPALSLQGPGALLHTLGEAVTAADCTVVLLR